MSGWRTILFGVAALALAGCQTLGHRRAPPGPVKPPPVIAPVRPAPRPVEPRAPEPRPAEPRACVPRTLASPPRYPDTDAALRAAGGAADRYQLLAAGRILRQQRLEELERVVSGCR